MLNDENKLDLMRRVISRDLPFDTHGQPRSQVEGTWFALLDLNGDVSADIRHQLVEEVMSEYGDVAYELANVKDHGGRRAFDVTDVETKQIFYDHLYFYGRYEIEAGPPVHRSATAVVVHAKDHKSTYRYTKCFDEKASGTVDGNEEDKAMDVAAFQACMKELCAEYGVGYDAQELDRFFSACDSDRSGTISREEFQRFCEGMLGTYRNVVIKFMHNKVCPQ